MTTKTKTTKTTTTTTSAVKINEDEEEEECDELQAYFLIYHKGVPITITTTTTTTDQITHLSHFVHKLCAIELTTTTTLLCIINNCLWSGTLVDNDSKLLLELKREHISDVAYCRAQQQLYIVTAAGEVLMQQLDTTTTTLTLQHENWQTLSFDPLELCEQGIRIVRLCAAAEGVLFLSSNNEFYACGKCGEYCQSVSEQPQHVRLFDEHKYQLLDMAAGDDFFVLLLQQKCAEEQSAYGPTLVQAFVSKSQNGHSTRSLLPPALEGVGVCHIATSREYALALLLDGSIFKWRVSSNMQPLLQHAAYGVVLAASCTQNSSITLGLNEQLMEHKRQLPINAVSRPLLLESESLPQLLLANGHFLAYNLCLQPLLRQHVELQQSVQVLQRQHKKFALQSESLRQLQKHVAKQPAPNMWQVCQYVADLMLWHEHLLLLIREWCHSSSPQAVLQKLQTFWELADKYAQEYFNLFAWSYVEEQLLNFAANKSSQLHKQFFQTLLRELQDIYYDFMLKLQEKMPQQQLEDMLQEWRTKNEQVNEQLSSAIITLNFWKLKERHPKFNELREQLLRRVLISTYDVPLKLAIHGNTLLGTQSIFVLCNDGLYQLTGTQLQFYAQHMLWLRDKPHTNSFLLYTPEQQWLLTARSEKQCWLIFIRRILEQYPANGLRSFSYTFSAQHRLYAQVVAKGSWRDGLLHGANCQLEYPTGKLYSGELQDGLITGYGKMHIPFVGNYEGYLKEGKFHGQGYYELREQNEVYEGFFRDNYFNGHGHWRSNYHTYIGEFHNNVRCGYGILDDMISGDKYMGMFADNKRNGPGTCITMTGDYFEGIYVNDELSGAGTAIFENTYYYEGELSVRGPNGKGTYYMPTTTAIPTTITPTSPNTTNSAITSPTDLLTDNNNSSNSLDNNAYCMGNIVSGQLNGTWQNVRIIAGNVNLNRQFPKLPRTFGSLIVDNKRKWRAVFEDFMHEVFGQEFPHIYDIYKSETTSPPTANGFFKGSNTSLNTHHILREQQQLQQQQQHEHARRIWQCMLAAIKRQAAHVQNEEAAESKQEQLKSILEFELQYHPNHHNNNTNNLSTQLPAIKAYLQAAFEQSLHPLHALNKRITTCFHTAYGCWRVKPTTFLAQQAMQEWDCICREVYALLRCLFPELPEDYYVLEEQREVVSHVTLLTPLMLTESIYSTLFVLYANKYNAKDENYRQNLLHAEHMSNAELMQILHLDG